MTPGSEQRSVLEQVVKPWCESQGYTCTLKLLGSVDQSRLLQAKDTRQLPPSASPTTASPRTPQA